MSLRLCGERRSIFLTLAGIAPWPPPGCGAREECAETHPSVSRNLGRHWPAIICASPLQHKSGLSCIRQLAGPGWAARPPGAVSLRGRRRRLAGWGATTGAPTARAPRGVSPSPRPQFCLGRWGPGGGVTRAAACSGGPPGTPTATLPRVRAPRRMEPGFHALPHEMQIAAVCAGRPLFHPRGFLIGNSVEQACMRACLLACMLACLLVGVACNFSKPCLAHE